jgi:PadR family transcriptional regulator PadR
MTSNPELFENLRLELWRGSITIAVLAQLRTELYGYALRKALADQGLAIDENTLYPLLRRLETQGLLESHWREEDKRNKRFYKLSANGEIILLQLLNELEILHAAVDNIMGRKSIVTQSPDIVPVGIPDGAHVLEAQFQEKE